MAERARRILVVEDDASLRELLVEMLLDGGYAPTPCADGAAALGMLAGGAFDLVLTDLRLPGADGLAVLRAARALSPPPPVVVLTAFGTVEVAVEAMRAGAFDFITKPVESPAALRRLVADALTVDDTPAPSAAPTQGSDDAFVADDPASRAVFELLALVARRDTTVLLTGESGVGKEVAARYLHAHSRRGGGPLIAVNCGAIPQALFESELFGHAKGAFTGAHSARAGVFEQASGGTLLLDEVGELPLAAQVKLLRVLEERRVTRVGEARARGVDVRVVAATHRDLAGAIAGGRFREDLYYRLCVFPVEVPPLRARPGDIVPLALAFLRRQGDAGLTLTPAAEQMLRDHPWPGNARELRNVMERAAIVAGAGPIDTAHLGLRGGSGRGPSAAAGAPAPRGATLRELERAAIEDALASTGGNRRAAAAKLGIALRTLQYKLKDYGLTRR